MIRTLAMIAVAGFVLSAVCISVAIGMAGPEFLERGAWTWDGGSWNWQWKHGHPGVHHEPGATRELAWSGGDTLQLDVPADVRFTQTDGPAKITVTGPRDVLDNLVVENGRIRSTPGFHMGFDDDRVNIEMSAPRVTRFEAHGSNRIDIQGYKQDRLAILVSGDAAVTAQGSAKAVDLSISGSGDVDLSGLSADGAEVKVSGSGSAKVGPKSWAKVYISGAGDVTLLGHPRQLETHVSGSGHIDQDEDAGPATPIAPEAPAKPIHPAKAV